MYNPAELIFFVFSYNRYAFLKNLVKSITLFYPQNKIIIYDDGSTETDLLDFYKELSENLNFEIIAGNVHPDNIKHSGLYNLMNLALEKAWQESYSYAFFIQDDMQFIQHIDISVYCKTTFEKWQNSIMISPLFLQKVYLPEIKKYIENKNHDYTFKNRGVADVGIIHLKRAKTSGLIFSSAGEKFNGAKYFNSGHELILSLNPCLAWVPWAFSYKNKRKVGCFIYNDNSLFINPINAENKVRLNLNKKIPFLEDFTTLNVKWIPKPYLSTNINIKNIIVSYMKYWKYIFLKRKYE